jgi:hypothetical protein
MRAAAPIGVAGIFAVVVFRIDTVMLAAFEPEAVVGQYGAAYRLFETTLFLSWAVGAAVYPVLSRSSRTSAPAVGVVYEGSLKLVVALTLPLAAAAAALSEPLVRFVFGADYAEAGDALALLAPAIVLYPISYVAGYLLVSQDRALVLTATYAFVAVENVLLNLVLIPRLSLEGAALGTSVSERGRRGHHGLAARGRHRGGCSGRGRVRRATHRFRAGGLPPGRAHALELVPPGPLDPFSELGQAAEEPLRTGGIAIAGGSRGELRGGDADCHRVAQA